MKQTTVFGLAAILMMSTGASAAGLGKQVAPMAQRAPRGAATAVSLTGGAGVFSMPDLGTGVFATGSGAGGGKVSSPVGGGVVSASVSSHLGRFDDWDVLLGFLGFGAWANGTFTSANTLSGPGVITVTGGSAPGTAGMALVTSSGGGSASGSSTVTNTNPQGGGSTTAITVLPSTSVNNQAAVTPAGTGNSFTFAGVVTNGAGNSAAAYGAAADTSGGVFIGVGDLSGLSVVSTTSRHIFYGGADLTLALAGQINEKTGLQFYAGPSYRTLNEDDQTKTAVNIAAVQPSATVFPQFGVSRIDQLRSNYYGGVLGGSVVYALQPRVVVSVGAEGGIYDATTDYTGTGTYSIGGGSSPAGPFGPQTVTADPVSASSNGVALAGRGSASVTFALNRNTALTMGGNAEVLSHVGTVSPIAPTISNTQSGDDATLNYMSASGGPVLAFGNMWRFAGTLSLTGSF